MFNLSHHCVRNLPKRAYHQHDQCIIYTDGIHHITAYKFEFIHRASTSDCLLHDLPHCHQRHHPTDATRMIRIRTWVDLLGDQRFNQCTKALRSYPRRDDRIRANVRYRTRTLHFNSDKKSVVLSWKNQSVMDPGQDLGEDRVGSCPGAPTNFYYTFFIICIIWTKENMSYRDSRLSS